MLKISLLLLSVCYPFVVYWGLQSYDARALLPVVVVLLSLRWLAGCDAAERKVMLASVLLLLLVALAYGDKVGVKFYPVLMNLSFLILFASSLINPPSIVERLARIKEPELSDAAMAYTRTVTKVWCGFFVFNGTLALTTTLWASDQVWLLYNGLLAYLLMGTLMAAEWIVRRRVRRVS